MRVLVACEYSGRVRDAFTAAGHDAISCDLLPTESEGKHYHGDIFDLNLSKFDLMIAHPPCTYLSNAGARWLYPNKKLNMERYENGLKAKKFFMALLNCGIPKICVENPVPSKIFELPIYSQTIEPYHFGHPFKKKTCLWLKGLEPLQPTQIVTASESTKVAGNWFNKGGVDRQKNRAKTFEGIADAMSNQWG